MQITDMAEKYEYRACAFEEFDEVLEKNWWEDRHVKIGYHYLGETFCFFSYCELMGFGFRKAEESRKRLTVGLERHTPLWMCQDLSNEDIQSMTRTALSRVFLRDYIDFFIERHPDDTKDRIPMMVKIDIYRYAYKSFMKHYDRSPIEYSWFCQMWMQMFGDLLMTDKRRFGQCSTCGCINRAFFQSDSMQERKEMLLVKSAHMEEIRNYRRHATMWHSMSLHAPQESLFLMMDGMDQNKTSLPFQGR
jgi:hypothetical protein